VHYQNIDPTDVLLQTRYCWWVILSYYFDWLWTYL